MSVPVQLRESDLRYVDRYHRLRAATLAECHEHQRAVLNDPAQYLAALCGRRSGKTELDARAIGLDLEKCGPDEWCAYAARTRVLAKDLLWTRLRDFRDRHQLAWTMRENEGMIQTSRGGAFRLFGFDKLPELEKLRGYKLRRFIADEPATYAEHLRKLIISSVGPALGDLRGTCQVNGTPGHVCAGYWYEISARPGRYSVHHWTALQNPLFPRDAREWFATEQRDNGWTDESAEFRREYLAEWVDDPEALVYAFVRARNLRPKPEDFDRDRWLVTLGIDFGLRDECAWSVIASDPHSREQYVLRSFKRPGLVPDEAADITREVVDTYHPSTIVGDTGGLGAPYVEVYNRRYGGRQDHQIQPADKLGKRGHIKALNGDLRVPRLFVCDTGCDDLIDEIQHLPYKNEAREVEHPAYPNHCCDATLYAHVKHGAYWHEAQPPAKSQEDSWVDQDIERFQARQREAWHEL